ncbi:hypothetical protein SAMN04515609_0017 [Caldicellulosiruptor bescii]|nr:hypothetical protein SAMN04515609_0017 [Caldicellulosiruptor bescii]
MICISQKLESRQFEGHSNLEHPTRRGFGMQHFAMFKKPFNIQPALVVTDLAGFCVLKNVYIF